MKSFRALVLIVVALRAGAAPASQDRAFASAAQAREWLASRGITAEAPSLLIFLSGDSPESVQVMRAYVALGLPLDGPGGNALSPLTLVTRSCVGNQAAPLTTAVLIAAGANPTKPAPDGDKSTPLMEAVNCPAVLKAMLARKVDLNAVDARGYTVMHHALNSSEARDESSRIVRDAGFDVSRWSASLMKAFGHDPAAIALLAGVPAATAADLPHSGAIDWKALGPYPSRSRAEAIRLLSRPGADTSVADHFWDAINRDEPQRLALALAAGADVRSTSRGAGYTPLMTLADNCDPDRSALQRAIADQLIAAGADTAGVSADKSNALMIGSRRCSVEVVRAFIAAGVPLGGVDTHGNTALKQAILAGRADVVALLVDAGVDPSREPYNTGRLAAGNKAVQEALRRRPRK